jgi:hypothetical protein
MRNYCVPINHHLYILFAFFAFDPLVWGQSSAPNHTLHRPGDDRASAGRADSPAANEKTGPKSAAPDRVTTFDADPLLRVLVAKGVLTTAEARGIASDGKRSEQRDRLAQS